MKTAIISDIHSNPAALEKCLSDAKEQGCTRFVCLGDIVGYGYDPNACIDICRERNVECFLGNHDAGLIGKLGLDWFNSFAKDAILRQRPLVTEDNKKWLGALPYSGLEGVEDEFGYAFSHGTYQMPERFDYVHNFSDAVFEFQFLRPRHINVLFVGHTHYATIWFYDDRIRQVYVDLEDGQKFDLSAESECNIVNVGSIGYPRAQPYTIYGIYDTETHEFKHRILPFDFDDYTAKMEAATVPVPYWIPSRKKEAEDRPIGFR